ncbi:hypothetical protein J2Y63_002901 [Shinella sp. BE166]|uniref:hypothetical protein n=1 Tax=Shinella sp. BE166 TaxID=3373918 RepID=UPI003EC01625
MVERRFNSSIRATAYLAEMARFGLQGELNFSPRSPTDQLPFAVLFALIAEEDANPVGDGALPGESVVPPQAD